MSSSIPSLVSQLRVEVCQFRVRNMSLQSPLEVHWTNEDLPTAVPEYV